MEALLFLLAAFVLLVFPIWTLVLLNRLWSSQRRQDGFLHSLLARMDRLDARMPAASPPPAPTSVSTPASLVPEQPAIAAITDSPTPPSSLTGPA